MVQSYPWVLQFKIKTESVIVHMYITFLGTRFIGCLAGTSETSAFDETSPSGKDYLAEVLLNSHQLGSP